MKYHYVDLLSIVIHLSTFAQCPEKRPLADSHPAVQSNINNPQGEIP